jgi:plastocyanin
MNNRLRMLALGAGTCAVIALVSCGGGSTGPTASSTACNGSAAVSGLGTVAATIDATDNLVFVPASTTTSVGDVVEFKNTGTVAHTVTFQDANDGCLSDAMLNPGSSWEVKFTVAGTYNYLCTIHAPNMKGEITVTG